MNNSRGQALVEACLATLVIFSALASFSLLCYRGFVFYYCDFQLYEALICTQHSPASVCQDHLRQKISKILIFEEPRNFRVSQSRFAATGSISVQFPKILQLVSPNLEVRSSIRLPLNRTTK